MSGSRLTVRRAVATAGAALAAVAVLAPAASAQNFTLNECAGEGILGRGASFQTAAHTYWSGANAFKRTVAAGGCGSAGPNVLWDATGSGAGRAALGERGTVNPQGERDPSVRFAGTDEPPTTTQVDQIQRGVIDANGQDATAADNGKVHVIPVAISSLAVIVNLPGTPGQCSVGTDVVDLPTPGANTTRPKIPNSRLSSAWTGDITTWGQLIPTISGTYAGGNCADAPIKRTVRLDSSGSTFAFKDFLSKLDPAPWQGLGNTAWPKNEGATAVVRGDDNGGGSLRAKANATDGSISYLVLADARSGGIFTLTAGANHDDTFWLPIQRQSSATYDDPQAATDGFLQSSTARGANCTTAPIANAPASTTGDWSKASAVHNSVGYGICTLTYDLAFDDNAVVYCTSDAEQRKARTIKDYLTKGVLSDQGQGGVGAATGLPGADYAALPANILAIARAGANEIGWNKGGQGRPCTPQQPGPEPTPTPTPTPPGGGGGTPPPPPPAAISNAFTISSARVSGTTIRLSLQLPGAGKVSVASSTKPKKGKAITLATKTATANAAGAQTLSVALSAKAKSALRKDKKLKVTLKITYTPNGGQAKTITRSVTVKQAKKSS